jgi:carboxypeptidase PM20D1
MKKIALGLLAVLLALVAIVLARTLTLSSKQIQVEPVAIEVDKDAAAARLAAAVRFRTISHQERNDETAEAFDGLHAWFAETYPRVHSTLGMEKVSEHSRIYEWKGSDPSLDPALLVAHLDVVPVTEDSLGDWTHPPYAGVVADGYIWGRGTLDDKVSAVGILEAVERLLAKSFAPKRTLYLCFGHDEEISGAQGAVKIVERLREKGVKQIAFAIDEGLAVTNGMMPGIDGPVAFIGVTEKGYLSVELKVKGAGGHSSWPGEETPAGILSGAVVRLERNKLPMSLSGPARAGLELLAPEMDFGMKLAIGNLWLLGAVVEATLGAKPKAGALLRTTTAPTMLSGSPKENVLPTVATAVVNFRIKPGDTVAGVMEHVRNTVDDERVEIRELPGAIDPSPVSSTEGVGYPAIARSIREAFPAAVVAPQVMLAASDGRHYTPLGDVFRFAPLDVTSDDLTGIHGTNERIKVDNYAQAITFYERLIQNAQ